MSEGWAVEKAREWLAGWFIDKYRLLELLDGESGAKMVAILAALLEEVAREHDEDAHRAAMLVAVHGALVDAGFRVGEIGHCELDLVRQLARERDEARAEVERLRAGEEIGQKLLAGRDRQIEQAEAEVGRLKQRRLSLETSLAAGVQRVGALEDEVERLRASADSQAEHLRSAIAAYQEREARVRTLEESIKALVEAGDRLVPLHASHGIPCDEWVEAKRKAGV